jgi:hypothetical protein
MRSGLADNLRLRVTLPERPSRPPVRDSSPREASSNPPGTGEVSSPALPANIAGRYRVEAELGRGGMAIVYRVTDTGSGRQLAIKQLAVPSSSHHYRALSAAFEREYHTLVQLSHPLIVEVYDFGLDSTGPYYSMELLDGGDLREHSPLPYREACAIAYDVCSSLALLHSRRLVHRDISPRNVRLTHDGSAKLIDFGALLAIGSSGQIVGTPPFVPPEVLHRSALDGRSDLYSLGATLYYALTARLAYPARDFADLQSAWMQRPAPPSGVVVDVPPALDALVMSLISLDPAVRPRSAFEVMQRLAAIAGIERGESLGVSQAYLSTPLLVGREEPLSLLRGRIKGALDGRGGSLLVRGVAGSGRSRLLDACALEAKIAGASVLRVNAGTEGAEELVLGQALAEQALEALPELARSSAEQEDVVATLFEAAAEIAGPSEGSVPSGLRVKDIKGSAGDRSAIQSALTRFLLRLSNARPLAILVDDVQRLDEASLALLAALTLAAPRRQLLLALTAASEAPLTGEAFGVLERECSELELRALGRAETGHLLESLFGDAPNLALLSERVYQVAAGNPRQSLELAQWLLSKGLVRYERGSWSLPSELDVAQLPSGAAETSRERIAELSELARRLAEAHALASHPLLSREDYALLAPGSSAECVDQAITELLSQQILSGDSSGYALSRQQWSSALHAGLDESARAERHRALAQLYAKSEEFALERAEHLLAGGSEHAGLDLLMMRALVADSHSLGLLSVTSMRAAHVATLLTGALECTERQRRTPREMQALRRALVAISAYSDDTHYLRTAASWFAQLERDSGLLHFRQIGDAADSNERLMRALTRVSEQYAATPEDQRAEAPDVAIKNLVLYVVLSIVVGSRVQDGPLIASLPGVLEPFVALSPLLHAIWLNARATYEYSCNCRVERARALWLEVETALSKLTGAEISYVPAIRTAVRYGLGLLEARLGTSLAEERAQQLDQDPSQRVSAMLLRKIVRLHQGDFEGAEHFRKQAERLALEANVRGMFTGTVPAELIAHALASDLVGIRQLADAIAPMAARYPGWLGFHHLAQGYFEQARGELEAAREEFERGLAASEPDPRDPHRALGAWPRLEAAYIETLVSLDRALEARARGLRALATCAEREIDAAAIAIVRALALAEAKLGDYAQACARLEALIGQLTQLGISGLELGATYEARARIAIWSSDKAAIEHYGRLAAMQYRHGQSSPVGARYERLMDEARRAGVHVLPQLTEFHNLLTSAWYSRVGAQSVVTDTLAAIRAPDERAAHALRLLCQARAARSGHLYTNTRTGLRLAASFGTAVADKAHHAFATRYLEDQLDAADDVTVIANEVAEDLVTLSWQDRAGIDYDPQLLMGVVDGETLCAGVALLERGTHTAVEGNVHQLIDAVSAFLIRSGDADGRGSSLVPPPR